MCESDVAGSNCSGLDATATSDSSSSAGWAPTGDGGIEFQMMQPPAKDITACRIAGSTPCPQPISRLDPLLCLYEMAGSHLRQIENSMHEKTSPSNVDYTLLKDVKKSNTLCQMVKTLSDEVSILIQPVLNADSKYKCGICKIGFKRAKELKCHCQVYHTPEQCTFCKFTSITTYEMKAHIQRFHRSLVPVSTPPKPDGALRPRTAISCEVCGKTFQQLWYLKSHMRTHKVTYDYNCNICSRSFKEPWTLRMHMKTHRKKSMSRAVPPKGNPAMLKDGRPASPLLKSPKDNSPASTVLNPPLPYAMCLLCGFLCPIEILKTHESLHTQFLDRSHHENYYTFAAHGGGGTNDVKLNFHKCLGLVPHQDAVSTMIKSTPSSALDPITSMKVLISWQQRNKKRLKLRSKTQSTDMDEDKPTHLSEIEIKNTCSKTKPIVQCQAVEEALSESCESPQIIDITEKSKGKRKNKGLDSSSLTVAQSSDTKKKKGDKGENQGACFVDVTEKTHQGNNESQVGTVGDACADAIEKAINAVVTQDASKVDVSLWEQRGGGASNECLRPKEHPDCGEVFTTFRQIIRHSHVHNKDKKRHVGVHGDLNHSPGSPETTAKFKVPATSAEVTETLGVVKSFSQEAQKSATPEAANVQTVQVKPVQMITLTLPSIAVAPQQLDVHAKDNVNSCWSNMTSVPLGNYLMFDTNSSTLFVAKSALLQVHPSGQTKANGPQGCLTSFNRTTGELSQMSLTSNEQSGFYCMSDSRSDQCVTTWRTDAAKSADATKSNIAEHDQLEPLDLSVKSLLQCASPLLEQRKPAVVRTHECQRSQSESHMSSRPSCITPKNESSDCTQETKQTTSNNVSSKYSELHQPFFTHTGHCSKETEIPLYYTDPKHIQHCPVDLSINAQSYAANCRHSKTCEAALSSLQTSASLHEINLLNTEMVFQIEDKDFKNDLVQQIDFQQALEVDKNDSGIYLEVKQTDQIRLENPVECNANMLLPAHVLPTTQINIKQEPTENVDTSLQVLRDVWKSLELSIEDTGRKSFTASDSDENATASLPCKTVCGPFDSLVGEVKDISDDSRRWSNSSISSPNSSGRNPDVERLDCAVARGWRCMEQSPKTYKPNLPNLRIRWAKPKPKRHICGDCGMAFIQARQLRRHFCSRSARKYFLHGYCSVRRDTRYEPEGAF